MRKSRGLHPKDLKGYRNPTEQEKKRIYDCLERELKLRRKQIKVFRNIFVMFSMALTFGLVFVFFNGISDIPEFVIIFIVVCVCWMSTIGLQMIFGIKQMDSEVQKEYDYLGVMYPEGNIGVEGQFLFNHENIEHVFFRGYEDEERDEFIVSLEKYYTENQ